MRDNQFSARKTTPTRLTIGIQQTKNIVHITCGIYFNARANRGLDRDDTRILGLPLVSLGSFVSPRPSSRLALELKYAFPHFIRNILLQGTFEENNKLGGKTTKFRFYFEKFHFQGVYLYYYFLHEMIEKK